MDHFDRELAVFAASGWGEATLTQGDAAGLCKRATLALLAQLEAAGLAGRVELWRLSWAIEGKRRGDEGYNTHWVLLRDDEVIDVSARQFEPKGLHIRRASKRDEFERWRNHEQIDPDGVEMWSGGAVPNREIPPHWRDLVSVAPPGDLPDWPYPRRCLVGTSRWNTLSSP